MKREEMINIAKSNNYELCREVVDLSGNIFCMFFNKCVDLVFIYIDQKDGDFFMIGLYPYSKAMRLMDRFEVSR